MSDVGLGASLVLDIADALRRIDEVGQSVQTATTGIPLSVDTSGAEASITSAIDSAVDAADTSVTPEADATGVTSTIDDAVAAADTDVTVEADADTSAAQADLDALDAAPVEVEVTADTTEATQEIDQLEAGAAPITIPVDADTEAATQAIDSLSNAATSVGEALGDASVSSRGFSAANSIATGSVSGLADAIGEAGGKTAVFTGAAVGGVAVLHSLFTAGLDAVAVGQRFDKTFGDLSDTIQDINIGTLNGDLGDLAEQLGTDDEALKQAGIRLGQFGKNAGIAAPEVAKTVEQVLALSLNLRAANPALGEAGDIANALPGALARGGRALQNFGIDISSAEIQARALRDTGKATAAELTQYEKSAAGAQIATEKLGASFGQTFAEGLEDPQIKLEALKQTIDETIEDAGRPLVSPLIGFLTEAEPLAEGLTKTLGAFVQALTPAVSVLGDVIGPLGTLLDIIATNNPDLLTFGVGIVAAGVGISRFVQAVTVEASTANPVLAGLLASIGLISTAVSAFHLITGRQEEKEFANDVAAATRALQDQDGQLNTTTKSLGDYIDKSSEFADDGLIDRVHRLGVSTSDLVGFLRDGAAGQQDFLATLQNGGALQEVFLRRTGDVVHQLREYVDVNGQVVDASKGLIEVNGQLFTGDTKLVKALQDEQKILQASAESKLIAGVHSKDLNEKYLDLGKSTGDYITALQKATEEQNRSSQAAIASKIGLGEITQAQRDAAIEATRAADGTINYTAALAALTPAADEAAARQQNVNAGFAALAETFPTIAASYSNLTTGQVGLNEGLLNLAQNLANSGAGAAEFDVVAQGLGITTEQLTSLVDGLNGAVQDYANTVLGTLPSTGDAFTTAAQKADAAKEKLSARGIRDELAANVKAITDETANIGKLVEAGFGDAAAVAAQFGPQYVQALADGIKDSDKNGSILAQIESLVGPQLTNATTNLTNLVGTDLAPRILASTGQTAALIQQSLGSGFDLSGVIPEKFAAAGGVVVDNQGRILNAVGQVVGAVGTAVSGGLESVPISEGDAILKAAQATDANAAAWITSSTAAGQRAAGAAGLPFATDVPLSAGDGIIRAAQTTDSAAASWIRSATSAGERAGDKVAEGFKTNADPGVAAGVRGVGDKFSPGATFVLESTAHLSGSRVGGDFASGMAAGIRNGEDTVDSAAAAIVRSAERAARAEARSSSPSRLFAALGSDLAAGVSQGLSGGEQDVVSQAEQIVRSAYAAAAGVSDAQSALVLTPGGSASPFASDGGADAGATHLAVVFGPGAITVGDDGQPVVDPSQVSVVPSTAAAFQAERAVSVELQMQGGR